MGVADLADYPWDAVAPYAARAKAHPDGIVDLSIGSPVDPTPAVVARALASATDAHAYPQTVGTPALREAIVDWYARRRGVSGLSVDHVLPTVGSKELVALLPLLLGLGSGDIVVHPRAAYPTYEVGARLVGATPVAADDPAEWPLGDATGLGQLAWQPRRAGDGCCSPPCGGAPRPRNRRRAGLGRVLRRARLGCPLGYPGDPVGAGSQGDATVTCAASFRCTPSASSRTSPVTEPRSSLAIPRSWRGC